MPALFGAKVKKIETVVESPGNNRFEIVVLTVGTVPDQIAFKLGSYNKPTGI